MREGDGPRPDVCDSLYQAPEWMLESQSWNTDISQAPRSQHCPAEEERELRGQGRAAASRGRHLSL